MKSKDNEQRVDTKCRFRACRATGRDLTPRQAALVARYKELETANNEVAYREQASRGTWLKPPRPYPSEDIMRWLTNPTRRRGASLRRSGKPTGATTIGIRNGAPQTG